MLKERLRGAIVRNLMWKKAPYYICPYYNDRIICHPSFAAWMVRYNGWEPESRRYLEDHVREGDICIDVGAGVGHYTILFSRLVGTNGVVYAFEPDPFMFQMLRANIRLNDLQNVILSRCAIGDYDGEMSFYVSSGGQSSLLPMRGLRSIIQIRVMTIDSLNISPVDWVKIDTEGTEADVLRGMKATLTKNNPRLLIEFIPENGPVDELLAELEGWNIKGLDHNILCEKEREKKA